MNTNFKLKNLLLLILLSISCSVSSQTKKQWTIKVNSDLPDESKRVFDGKKVKEGTNRLEISKDSYVNVVIRKGAISNMIFVVSSDGITISTDLAVAKAKNPQVDHCKVQQLLCQIQCRLGKIPDPTRPGSCLDQCNVAFGACPFLPSSGGFGGLVLQ